MARLAEQIANGRVDVYDYFRSAEAPDEKKIRDWAENIPMGPEALGFFINITTGIILTKRAREAAETIAPLSWHKGYCPVCGGFPMLAVTKENGQKWLHCAQCSHEWKFPRLKCPYCEHENPKETNFFFVDSDKENKAFACDKCRKYLITINRPMELESIDPTITAIGLTHLDLLLQDKGFAPMAVCPWNTF
jgi:FdhE protein